MTRAALLSCIGFCTAMLVGAFIASGQWVFALSSLAIGAAWLLIEWRGQGQMAAPGMASMSILAAAAILDGFRPFLMVIVAVLALSAWDLSRFRQRLIDAVPGDTHRGIESRHLRLLLLIDAIGLLVAMPATGLQLHVEFYVLFFLGGFALVVIYEMLKRIARLE